MNMNFIEVVNIQSIVHPKPVGTGHHLFGFSNDLVEGRLTQTGCDEVHVLPSSSQLGNITERGRLFSAIIMKKQFWESQVVTAFNRFGVPCALGIKYHLQHNCPC